MVTSSWWRTRKGEQHVGITLHLGNARANALQVELSAPSDGLDQVSARACCRTVSTHRSPTQVLPWLPGLCTRTETTK